MYQRVEAYPRWGPASVLIHSWRAVRIVWPPRWCGIAIARSSWLRWRPVASPARHWWAALVRALWKRLGHCRGAGGELLVSGGFEFARQRPTSAVCAGLRSQLREMDERLPDRRDRRAVAAPPRAMAWLHQGSARGAFVRARRDLFSDLSLVSMDTASCRSTANTMASP